ncbi:hypothetical protein TorRG33x02_169350 [Trema orientale]|uniref:Uncharacterized protein n=1 Tax=Trema orientale TaxID=63057 RepID=A0A2P5EP62_TREOI|nr:hypothetical protein TorRG33x02_169350 [Trema orientale]
MASTSTSNLNQETNDQYTINLNDDEDFLNVGGINIEGEYEDQIKEQDVQEKEKMAGEGFVSKNNDDEENGVDNHSEWTDHKVQYSQEAEKIKQTW